MQFNQSSAVLQSAWMPGRMQEARCDDHLILMQRDYYLTRGKTERRLQRTVVMLGATSSERCWWKTIAGLERV